MLAKSVPVLAGLYLISPIDVLPDVIPLIGQMDDVALVLAALAFFVRICPLDAVTFHRSAIAEGRRYSRMSPRAEVIDAEWRRG